MALPAVARTPRAGDYGAAQDWERSHGGRASRPNIGLQPTPYSLRSYVAVRRESGMEECGNTLGVQAPNEPLGLSVIDHSMT